MFLFHPLDGSCKRYLHVLFSNSMFTLMAHDYLKKGRVSNKLNATTSSIANNIQTFAVRIQKFSL